MSETPRTPAHTPPQTLPMPAGGLAAISKYNPHLWSPEQLRAIFVARQNELADLLATLRNTPPDTVGQHVLVVGARGMGKSTLMQRLALAVDDDAELSTQWLALRFPEEQYTVSALNQFWANVLDALADALERRSADLRTTQALDDEAARIASLPMAEQTAAYLQTIADCAQTQGQRLLLLVDNTDFLLSNIGKDAQWALRDVLQTQRHLLWVGGSYQSLEAHSEYHDAFLDFFRVLELRPLKLQEMQAALLALAQTFGGAAAHAQMQTTLRTQPERLATLRQLSGGNPRTTVMLYTLLAGGQAGQVRSDLEILLDDMTPLYKSRLDNLADMQRKLLAHILEHWSPIAMGELEQVSQIKASTISGQLKRLELEGLIERTSLHGTTRSGYQVAERFFNIWYLMRMSPRRRRSYLLWLVEFMRLWFSPDELHNMAQSRTEDPQLRLQAQLALGNRQLALDALNAMVQLAQQSNNEVFDRLKVQVWECSELGLGETLADWMRASPQALFLQPFVQALYQLAGATAKLQDLPQEVQQMADAVVRLGMERRSKASAVQASSRAQAVAASSRAASADPI
jgi:DNA-binding transcriptional regulator GbsR (MarR family)